MRDRRKLRLGAIGTALARVLVLCALIATGPSEAASRPAAEGTPFEEALERGHRALSTGSLEQARAEMVRALERDAKSAEAWKLRADIAAACDDADDRIWSLHRRYALRLAQKARRGELDELRAELEAVDPIARDLLDLKVAYVARLLPLAEAYEREKRPHSAIRVHQQILALDPERLESSAAIERISSAPDPSLAATARAKDLFEGISDEWIAEFDAEHGTWDTKGELERDNYFTKTDAGYEILVRAAEAMEQMNGFYREFFRYGTEEDGRSVPRIFLHIFRNRDEYLKLGIGPPVEWSGGHFTGSAVETYVGPGGFEEVVGTLFHEAAHQFVSLATNAVGWLNEGLASYFEGSRILANGTVITNMPANHRLFPLAERMERGWMSGPSDGIDPANASSEPQTAPTFRIVLENRYAWGPPWYAPTWGVVYFLWNYQDPIDGRFVYRGAFKEFIDKSGGRSGEGAVENFEEVVLRHPQARTKGVDFDEDEAIRLAASVDELDPVWKDWILRLRDEQAGKKASDRPWLDWARHALTRKDHGVAREHFEKGILEEPENVELLVEFAQFLKGRPKDGDRAAKLVLRALQVLESMEEVDEKRVKEVDALLTALDPKRRTLDRLLDQLEASARGIATRYLAAGRPMMAMEVSHRLGTDLQMPALFEIFADAARRSGRSLALWRLAYDERGFDGWIAAGNDAFHASGVEITSSFGDVRSTTYDYQFLIYDQVTSGDFSFEAELLAENNVLSFAGLVFGKKAQSTFHALIYYPGRTADARYGIEGRQASVDLTSFFGPSDFRIWRHNSLPGAQSGWHRLRIDLVGTTADVWYDGELVVSQSFPSLEVVRGAFGLITGPGAARWRNVRFLARNALDPGALIERELTLQRLREEALATGRPIGSSFVDLVPPFPQGVEWVTEPRESFEEAGAAPQLLVFFSKEQNEKLPIHRWLANVVKKHEDVGMRAICIAAPDDADLAQYLEKHPFPGAVGFDTRPPSRASYGRVFEQFFIPRFNLPRVLLLDVDQRVAWEGDPGLELGKEWKPGDESYLDAPLQELLARRHLRAIKPWKREWDRGGEQRFREGDLAAVLPLLQQAEQMRGALDPGVLEVQQHVKILRAALAGIGGTVLQLEHEGAQSAIPALIEWAALLGQPLSAEEQGEARAAMRSDEARRFAALVEKGRALAKKVLGRDGIEAARPFVAELQAGPEPFGPLYGDRLNAVLASDDPAQIARLLQTAETAIPARWLARRFFRW